jgi:SAM-dependent methyltransferase
MPCRACGVTQDSSLLWESVNLREDLASSGAYWRCAACGSANLHPTPAISELQSAYDDILLSPPGPAQARTGLRRLLRRTFPNPHEAPGPPSTPGAKLLDLGCGSGAKLALFDRLGWDCYGIDISPRAIAHAAQIVPPQHLFAGQLSDAPFSAFAFDVVRSDNVVEHLLDPLAELRHVHRLLKRSGQLFLYVPHLGGLTLRLLRGGSISSWIPFHLTLFSRPGLKALLERAGFANVRLSSYSPPDWISLSVAQEARRRGASREAQTHLSRAAGLIARPIGWLSTAVGAGEELIGAATRT